MISYIPSAANGDVQQGESRIGRAAANDMKGRWPRSRRVGSFIVLVLVVTSVVAGSAATRLAPREDVQRGESGAPVELELVALGLERPVQVTNAADGTNRLFMVEKKGRIIISQNGQVLATPFLDIEARVQDNSNEQGLLSVAFHPQYETNRRFYVFYTGLTPTDGGLVIAEYQAMAGNPNVASTTERRIIEIPHALGNNHNGGLLKFGPDGYLYAATGDGGSANDPDENGQDIDELLGKILRFDVNGAQPYAVPADNPFVGVAGRDEIYAYGLRNTWRYSFDRLTGQLWAGDVGQNQYEEVDIITKGGNYGWKVMEGRHCRPPTTGCDTSGKILPVFEYAHDGSNGVPSGCSITGGYVYRGTAIPSLYGKYVFADYCLGVGQLLTLTPDADDAVIMMTGANSEPVVSFGEDETGELYVVTDSVFGGRGAVYRIVLREGACDLRCAGDVTVDDTDADGSEVVTFDAAQPAGECGVVTCDPASGSVFDVGTTNVTCTSTIGGGSCSFNVTVEGAAVLAVTDCTPPSARRKASLTVAVGGTGFLQGATVSFGPKITVKSVTVVSPTRLDVSIKIKKKAARIARDVVVTNPGGESATGIAVFTVE